MGLALRRRTDGKGPELPGLPAFPQALEGGVGYLNSWKESDLSGPSAQIQHAHTAASRGFQTAWSTGSKNQHSTVMLVNRWEQQKK